MTSRPGPRVTVIAAALLALPLIGSVGVADENESPRITTIQDLRVGFREARDEAPKARARGWPGSRPTEVDLSTAWRVMSEVMYRWQERPRSLRLLVGQVPAEPFPRWWSHYLPAPERIHDTWRVRALIASYKDSYRRLAMRLQGEPGMLELDLKVGPEFRFTNLDQAYRLGNYLDVPMVLPSVATGSNFLPERSSLTSMVFGLTFLVDGEVLRVDLGDAQFDGCGGPDNATEITIAGTPAMMEEDSPHAGSYVIWPASRKDPWAKFGLFGDFPMSSLVQWASEMIEANRARHAAQMGC